MYDVQTLVSDSRVHVAFTRFPVTVTVGNRSFSKARFALAQVPGTGTADNPAQWVAIAWEVNSTGGPPLLVLAYPVSRMLSKTPNFADLLLDDGSPDGLRVSGRTSGQPCCGSRLSMDSGWGVPYVQIVRVPAPVPPPVAPVN